MRISTHPWGAAGAGALLAVALTACGGGAPTEASVADFCGIGPELQQEKEAIERGDYEAQAELSHELSKRMSRIGTPADIPDEAREGFEIVVENLSEKTASAIKNETAWDVAGDEKAAVEAYRDYRLETCRGGG